MRTLPLEFTSSPQSKVGHRDFKQIHREPDYAIYSKSPHGDPHVNSYEAFFVKRRYKGEPLPGGLFEKEDREVYPSHGQFGFTAFDCKTEADAFERIKWLKSKKNELPVVADEDESLHEAKKHATKPERPEGAGRRGKVAKVIKLPIPRKGETFTMKMLMADTGESQPMLYIRLKTLLEASKVVEHGKVREDGVTRGRAQTVYRSETDEFVNP